VNKVLAPIMSYPMSPSSINFIMARTTSQGCTRSWPYHEFHPHLSRASGEMVMMFFFFFSVDVDVDVYYKFTVMPNTRKGTNKRRRVSLLLLQRRS